MSALCKDCGTDTTPCTGKRGCRHVGKWEYYMVRADIWAEAGMEGMRAGFLCIGCLEDRLGRELHAGDFTGAPVNEPHPRNTPRLADRLERFGEGFVEMQAELEQYRERYGPLT